MAEPNSPPPRGKPDLPMSGFGDSIHDLLHREVLRPPEYPGILGALGDYEIAGVLGVGGMGIVLLAREGVGGELRALKLLRPELAGDDRARVRFLAEARRMEQFDHPGIVPVLKIDFRRGVPFFVMPYFPQGSLAARLREGRPFAKAALLRIAADLAAALAHAHERGIIHRDLKPANVLLTRQERACLSDFGLARNVFNEDIDRIDREHREGTAPYMSPRVAAGKAEDTRCDIYAFGAVLYELLTGRPPYGGEAQEILAAILAGPPAPVRKVNPDAPADLVAIATWCLARELRARYAEMRDVRNDLERVASGKPPKGPRASSLALVAQRLRQSGRGLAAMLVLSSLIVGGMAFYRAGRPRLDLVCSITVEGVANWARAKVGHIEGEPFPAIYHTDGTRLLGVDLQGTPLFRGPPLGLSRNSMVDAEFRGVVATTNLLGDGTDELIVNWARQGENYVSIFSAMPHELVRFSAEHLNGLQRETGRVVEDLAYRGVLRGPGVKEPLLLATFTGANSNALRGLSAYALESGEPRWIFQTATYLREVIPASRAAGKERIFVVGSYATGNRVTAPDGTDDDHSYLYGLSVTGKLLWRRELGTLYTAVNPMVEDLDDDGEPEILVWITGSYDDRKAEGLPEMGPLLVLNLDGRILHRLDLGTTLLSVRIVDLGPAAGKVILATDRLGRLHEVSPDLAEVNTRTLEPVRYTDSLLRLAAVNDLDLDGKMELLFTVAQREFVSGYNAGTREYPIPLRRYHDIELVVRDLDFNELARARIARFARRDELARLEVLQADPEVFPEILWLGESHCLLYDFRPAWGHRAPPR